MRAAIILLGVLPLSILGCRSGGKTVTNGLGSDSGESDTDTDTDADTDLDLRLDVDPASIAAGMPVDYTVTAIDEDDNEETVSGATLSSDLEAELAVDSATLIATLAGTHTITATATLDGSDLSAQATLEVVPGALDWLDLTMEDSEVVAGEALGFTLSGTDAYGNVADVSVVDLSLDSTDVSIDGETVVSTVAGTYALTASQDSLEDTESFTVVPSEPAHLSFSLDEDDLEAGETSSTTVVVTDEYGNEIEADWTITVDGTGEASVDGGDVTFEEEGTFEVTITVEGTDLEETIEIVIDSVGPILFVDTPNRGSWTLDSDVTVSGTVMDSVTGVTSLTVGGTPVTPTPSGTFEHSLSLQHGINVIETIALDGDTPEPNQSSDVRAALRATEWAGTSTYWSEGLVIRMNEGPGGLDALSSVAEEMIDIDAIGDMMLGEIWSGSFWFFSFTVNVTEVNIAGIDVSVDTYGTHLRLTAVINDIDVDGNIEGSGGGDFDLTAESITAVILLDPSVDVSGNIEIEVYSTEVTPAGLVFDASGGFGAIESIAGWFGVDVDGMIEDELSAAIEDTLSSTIAPMVEEAMAGIRVSQSMDIGDNSYTILALPESVDVDGTGLDIPMKTLVSPYSWESAGWAAGPPGPPMGDYLYPTFADTSGGTELALGIDFLNQLMYAVWGGGLLDNSLTDEDLGIDIAAIALVLPGLTDLTLVTTPTLPPMIVPHEDVEAGTELAMQLGDLFVEIYDGEVSEDNLYMELYVSAHVPLSLLASSAGDALSVELGDPVVWVDVVSPDPSSPEAAGAEAAFAVLLPVFLPEITGAFDEIPIPSFAGFMLADVETTVVGTDDGHLMISGDLSSE